MRTAADVVKKKTQKIARATIETCRRRLAQYDQDQEA
jgi:hypothetical protein